MTTLELLNYWALSVVAVLWFFMFGAALGSFLNVLVYRLPRGLPVAWSGSRCPKCANPIAFRDNIPVVSWLVLRGKCKACGQQISGRYPVVEATVGSMFVLLLFVEVLSGGRNLPVRVPNRLTGPVFTLFETQWDLLAFFGYHAGLLYLLLGIALVELDRRKIPGKLLLAGLLLGLALPMATPGLHPVSWRGHAAAPRAPFRPLEPWADRLGDELATLFVGLAAGAGLGWLVSGSAVNRSPRVRQRSDPLPTAPMGSIEGLPDTLHSHFSTTPLPHTAGSRQSTQLNARHSHAGITTLWGLTLIGMYLGWQAALLVAVLVFLGNLVCLGVQNVTGRAWPAGMNVWLAAMAQIVFWRWWAKCPYLPGPYAGYWANASCLLFLICGATAVAIYRRQRVT